MANESREDWIELIFEYEFPHLPIEIAQWAIYKKRVDQAIASLDPEYKSDIAASELRLAVERAIMLGDMDDDSLRRHASSLRQEAAVKAARQAEEAFLTDPKNQPDYERYSAFGAWTEEEAVALLIGVSPDSLDRVITLPSRTDLRTKYKKVRELVSRALAGGEEIGLQPKTEEGTFLQPSQFLNWAISKRIPVSEELILALKLNSDVQKGETARSKEIEILRKNIKKLQEENAGLSENLRKLSSNFSKTQRTTKNIFSLLRHANFDEVSKDPSSIEEILNFLQQAAEQLGADPAGAGSDRTLRRRFLPAGEHKKAVMLILQEALAELASSTTSSGETK